MSRATAALPPALRRSKRRAVAARRLPRSQPEADLDLNEDEEPVTENESDDTEGLSAVHVEPTFEGLSDLRCESAGQALHVEPTFEGLSDVRCESAEQALRRHIPYDQSLRQGIARESELREFLLRRSGTSRPFGPVRREGDVRGENMSALRDPIMRGESHSTMRGESHPVMRGESHPALRGESHVAAGENPFFEGPDMGDPEVRATMTMLTSTFKIQQFNPEAPDMWVESIDDALFSAGMSAVFHAADCRRVDEVPVRLRNCVDLIPRWKLVFVWTAIRRSLQSVPSVYNRTQRTKKGDVEGVIRSVLDFVQKRSQGLESRLREELAATNLVDFSNLKAYISDLETKFNKLLNQGVVITESERRHILLRGLTPEYNSIKASILTYRNRYNQYADFTDAVSMLEDYDDNTLKITTRTVSNQEVTLTTHEKAAPGEQNGICFHFAKRGHCRRGKACKFRHVERPAQAMVRQKHQKDRQNRKMPPGHYRRLNTQQGKGAGNAQKTGACHNCGKRGHWARDCRAPKVERANVTNDWVNATWDVVNAGGFEGLEYISTRWLVDSASTCMVANEV